MEEVPYTVGPPEPPVGGSKTGMTLGIIGAVVGGLGICAGFGCAWLGYVAFIAALILGIIGLNKGKEDEDPQTAKILGIVAIALGMLTLLISCGNHIFGFYLLQTGHVSTCPQMDEFLRQLQP